VGTDIIQALKNAVAYTRGDKVAVVEHIVRVPEQIDVRAVRAKLGMSQHSFAARFGVSLSTVRNWEQGRRRPEGPARVLLTIIDREPEAVERALAS
jgi:putative transcriptional regulator